MFNITFTKKIDSVSLWFETNTLLRYFSSFHPYNTAMKMEGDGEEAEERRLKMMTTTTEKKKTVCAVQSHSYLLKNITRTRNVCTKEYKNL